MHTWKILIKRDTECNWLDSNPILKELELVAVIKTYPIKHVIYKLGDGKTEFKKLPYYRSLKNINTYCIYHKDPDLKVQIYLNPLKVEFPTNE